MLLCCRKYRTSTKHAAPTIDTCTVAYPLGALNEMDSRKTNSVVFATVLY